MTINPGDRVRSFDFDGRDLEGERACYVEGTVVGITPMEGCDRYEIKVERGVFGGKPLLPEHCPETVYPPVNGTATWLGRATNCVELMEETS